MIRWARSSESVITANWAQCAHFVNTTVGAECAQSPPLSSVHGIFHLGTWRTSAAMQPPHRLKEIRKSRQLSQTQLAKLIGGGVQHSTISRLERGDTPLTLDWMNRLADVLACAPQELITGEAKPRRLVIAPLIDWVQAGQLTVPADPYAVGDAKDHLAVPYHRNSVFALDVRGNSMNREAADGSIIVVDYEDRVLIDGKMYVIRADGEVTFKRYRAAPDRFEPYSTEPDHPTVYAQDGLEVIGRVVLVTKRV